MIPPRSNRVLPLQLPGGSHGPVEQCVGLAVVEELLLYRIPAQLPPQPGGNELELAECVCADGDLDRSRRLVPPFDGVDEVGPVIGALKELHLVGSDLDVSSEAGWPSSFSRST